MKMDIMLQPDSRDSFLLMLLERIGTLENRIHEQENNVHKLENKVYELEHSHVKSIVAIIDINTDNDNVCISTKIYVNLRRTLWTHEICRMISDLEYPRMVELSIETGVVIYNKHIAMGRNELMYNHFKKDGWQTWRNIATICPWSLA